MLNTKITVNSRTITGSYLTLYVIEYGKFVWLRVSNYLPSGTTLKSGTVYKPFKPSNIPMYDLYRRIMISDTIGFVFQMSSDDGTISITPFGGNIAGGTGINISEFYIQK